MLTGYSERSFCSVIHLSPYYEFQLYFPEHSCYVNLTLSLNNGNPTNFDRDTLVMASCVLSDSALKDAMRRDYSIVWVMPPAIAFFVILRRAAKQFFVYLRFASPLYMEHINDRSNHMSFRW
jgi:hypothetical protein